MACRTTNVGFACLHACILTALGLRQQQHLRGTPQPLGATQYYGVVHVGKPAQEFRVIFDTASSQLILPSSKCDDPACGKHHTFNADNSSSAIQIGWADDPLKAIADGEDRDTKSISLFGADVIGEFARDTLCVGDGAGVCGAVDFVLLTEEPDEPFADLDFDGVLGLAVGSDDAKEFNVLQNLLGKQVADKNVFAFYFAPSVANGVSGGELHLGGYRKEHLASDLVWATVSQGRSGWQVRVDDILVGGKSTGLCGASGCQAAVDTGASLIMAPGHVLHAAAQGFGAGDECDGDFPTLGFVVGGSHLEVSKADYVEHDDDGCRLLLTSLTGAAKGGPQIVFGYPFLRKYYSVFDAGKAKVGFAPTTSPPKTSHKDGVFTVQLVGLRP